MAAQAISFTISAVDRATATIERVNRNMGKMTRPYANLAKSAKRFSEASGFAAVGRNLGNVAKEADKVLRSVTKIGAPLLAIVGGGTIAGLSEMVTQWERIGAQTERTSRMLGITANQLTQMRGAATLMGVSSDSMTAGFQSLQDTLQNARWGRDQGAFAALQALGIRLRTTRSGAIDTQAAMGDLADVFQRIQTRDPAAARNLARSLGVEQLLPVLVQGRAALQKYEVEARRLRGDFTPDMARHALDFTHALSSMGLSLEGLRASIADRLAPVLGPMIEHFANWIATNRELISQRIAALVERIARAFERLFEGVDWDAFLSDIGDAAEAISNLIVWLLKVIHHLGGFKTVATVVALYMAGGFVSSLASAVLSIAGLVTRLGGLMTTLGSAGTAATTAAEAVAGARATAAGAGAAGAGTAAAGAAGAAETVAGGGLLAGALGTVARFVNPWTVGAYLGFHSEELGGKSEEEQLARIRAAEAAAAAAGQGHGAGLQPADAAGTAPYAAAPGSSAGGAQRVSRGIRNNNPGNIEYGAFARRMGATGSDGRFAIFASMQQGTAAMMALIKGYRSRGINTIAGIVSRYAPATENRTAAYVASIAKRTGINPNAPLPESQYASVQAAMAIQESGYRGTPLPPLNVPPAQAVTVPAPVVNVSNQVNVARDGRTSIRTQTPTGLKISTPLQPEWA
ncbi:hypothetical protein [Paraburkholderia adhaesiva]|uniref:hypothetical protein n=1 Tax=Paraburkholderia adhaesiva TaxID=2883244 RepID=UPI001F2D0E22|nr:hypothetical protein [Paraburkholderia adhaesiva]